MSGVLHWMAFAAMAALTIVGIAGVHQLVETRKPYRRFLQSDTTPHQIRWLVIEGWMWLCIATFGIYGSLAYVFFGSAPHDPVFRLIWAVGAVAVVVVPAFVGIGRNRILQARLRRANRSAALLRHN